MLPIKIVFQSEVLGDEHRLAIFLNHVEIVGGVYLALKQNSTLDISGLMSCMHSGAIRIDRVFEEFCNEVRRSL